jgi:phage FluMu protein Com
MPVHRRDESVTPRTLREVRCGCGRLLCKTSTQPLRHAGVVEIKCEKCGEMNYLMGGPES